MITPLIHRVLKREDLARLVAEIGRLDQGEARVAEEAVRAGEVDAVLDSAAALDAVRGRGCAPAAVPLTLLWYVPVRGAPPARGCCAPTWRSPPKPWHSPRVSWGPAGRSPRSGPAPPTKPKRCTRRWPKRGATIWAATSTAVKAGWRGFWQG